ncbi:MAG: type II asparaginase [Bacteroidetes bacterium]|nr:type II asparaginase [Bacteroidota bacterium]
MNKRFLFSCLLIGSIAANLCGQDKPRVYILATGGTIAGIGASETSSGYIAGVVSVDKIIQSAPEILQLAQIKGEQVVNIPSQDMSEADWLIIAKRVNQLLSQADVTGIVITHGTDTMEETAFFLNLVVKSDKPVVLAGAMRPSTEISADGPMNVYEAVAVAASPLSIGKGVMIVMDDKILSADDAMKTMTTALETFKCPNFGFLGYLWDSKPIFTRNSLVKHTIHSEFDVADVDILPKVAIVYGYAGIDSLFVATAVRKGVNGIVYAGVGNGNPNTANLNALADAVKHGIPVVRSARTPFGPTTQHDEVDDDKYRFSASWFKTPEKSRILLMLALMKTKDYKEIQRMFVEY